MFEHYIKNGKINYIHIGIRMIMNFKFISNLTSYLLIIFIIMKNTYLIDCLIPLAITNGLFICYYVFVHFKEFDKETITKMCKNDTDNISIIISKLKELTKYKFLILQIIIHFIIPLFIYYLKNKEYLYLINNKPSFIDGLFISLFIICIWFLSTDIKIYNIIGINKKNINRFSIEYLSILFCSLIIYYNIN
jgi:hypothetical protein